MENYIQLAKRIIPDNDTTESKVRVTENDNLGVFVKIISNKFITDVDEKTDPKYTLRIMKSCFLNYYSVVALRKHSTYTQYFNEKIRLFVPEFELIVLGNLNLICFICRLQEFGIITHWGSSIQGAKNNYMRPYFTQSDRNKERPKKISIQNLSGAFWLLLIALVLATVVFLIENFIIYWKK